MPKERLYTLEFDSQNSYILNDADPLSTENAFAYGIDTIAIAECSQSFGTRTRAGMYGYGFNTADITVDNDKNITTIFFANKKLSDFNALNTNTYIGIQANGYYQWPCQDLLIKSINKVINNNIEGVNIVLNSAITLPKDAEHQLAVLFPLPIDGNIIDVPGDSIIGLNANSFGLKTKAMGDESHAEGYNTEAIGRYAHAEGNGTLAGFCAHSEGLETKAKGFYSHSEGVNTLAQGTGSHAEGSNTKALEQFSHAEGKDTEIGKGAYQAHAEGLGTVATASSQHVEGKYNLIDVDKEYLHILGNGTKEVRSNAHTIDKNGNAWFAGTVTTKNGQLLTENELGNKIDEGVNKALSSKFYVTAGKASGTTLGKQATAEGYNTTASGDQSHAEGNGTLAKGIASHAEGGGYGAINPPCAYGNRCHAEGAGTLAGGDGETLNDKNQLKTTSQAHAEGLNTKALGENSHTEGNNTQTTFNAAGAHAEGLGTIAVKSYQHVQGKYNIADPSQEYVHIVGNGENSSNRSNAHTLDKNGNAWYKGRIQCGGTKQDDDIVGRVPCVFTGDSKPQAALIGDIWINTGDIENNAIECETIANTATYSAASTKWSGPNATGGTPTIYFGGKTSSGVTQWCARFALTEFNKDKIPAGTKCSITRSDGNEFPQGTRIFYSVDDKSYTDAMSLFTSTDTNNYISLEKEQSIIDLYFFNNITTTSDSSLSLYIFIHKPDEDHYYGMTANNSNYINVTFTVPDTYAPIQIKIADTVWQQIG